MSSLVTIWLARSTTARSARELAGIGVFDPPLAQLLRHLHQLVFGDRPHQQGVLQGVQSIQQVLAVLDGLTAGLFLGRVANLLHGQQGIDPFDRLGTVHHVGLRRLRPVGRTGTAQLVCKRAAVRTGSAFFAFPAVHTFGLADVADLHLRGSTRRDSDR